MREYRIYGLSKDGGISKSAKIIMCETDREAVEKARTLMDDRVIEIWNGPRRLQLAGDA
jgi:hypothetical protein